ncbi:MAG: glutamate-1-semialdehyde 2,1-aminomutase [Syntrophobacteraceae bacterium]
MSWETCKRLYEEASRVIPGGVNSPVRSGRAVGMHPLFIREAKGCWLTDEDGNRYIDYVASWGPMILGHAHPRVVEAVCRTAEKGTSFGIPTELETRMARKVVDMVPSMDMVRMVSSGTEATMSAIRLARGYTGRSKVIKFNGCYHGHADSLLVQSGSGLATFGIPGSPGVPEEIVRNTLSLPFNDLDEVKSVLEREGSEVAAIIVEPVPANMGLVPPRPEYLAGLRQLCDRYGVVLIFDEVITGFRLAPGGAQQHYGVMPDLTCLGKIIGGGLPVGAYGGTREIMTHLAPAGNVYQAGTLSGNPVAMSAGLATLELLCEEGIYESLDRTAAALAAGIGEAAAAAGVDIFQTRVRSIGCSFFTKETVTDYKSAQTSDTEAYGIFFREMLREGVYLAPSQFEAFFISTAHGQDEIDRTVEAAGRAFKRVKETKVV